MKFQIRRASYHWPDKAPCEEAKKGKGRSSWLVSIDTLEELLEFAAKHGELIISNGTQSYIGKVTEHDVHKVPTIQIYDWFME